MKRSDYIPFHEIPFGTLPAVEGFGTNLNELGYQTSEFTRTAELALVAIGDETLQGKNGEKSFCEIAGDLIAKSTGKSLQTWNLGLPGRGVDYVTRTLMCAVEVLRPNYALLHFPALDRREYFRNDGKRLNYSASLKEAAAKGLPSWKKLGTVDKINFGHINELHSERDDGANFLKDYKLIEAMLTRRGIKWNYSCDSQSEALIIHLIEAGWLDNKRFLGVLDPSRDANDIGHACFSRLTA